MTSEKVMAWPEPSAEYDFWQGYVDGRDPLSPEPSGNRSHCYRHSFEVGRAELANNPIPAARSREKARIAEQLDGFTGDSQ